MKQVWSVSVLVAFFILEGRAEFANFIAVNGGNADMSLAWHVAWVAIDASAALVAGTIFAFIIDAMSNSADELSHKLAPSSINVRK